MYPENLLLETRNPGLATKLPGLLVNKVASNVSSYRIQRLVEAQVTMYIRLTKV